MDLRLTEQVLTLGCWGALILLKFTRPHSSGSQVMRLLTLCGPGDYIVQRVGRVEPSRPQPLSLVAAAASALAAEPVPDPRLSEVLLSALAPALERTGIGSTTAPHPVMTGGGRLHQQLSVSRQPIKRLISRSMGVLKFCNAASGCCEHSICSNLCGSQDTASCGVQELAFLLLMGNLFFPFPFSIQL